MVMSWISKLFRKKKEVELPRNNANVMTRRQLAVRAARAKGKKNALR